MITVNNEKFEWFEGITMATIVKMYQTRNPQATASKCLYLRNNLIIDENQLDSALLCDGDIVNILNIVAGG